MSASLENFDFLCLEPFQRNQQYFCREGNGNPLQYSCLQNPIGGGAWWAAVHGVTKSWTRLSDFSFNFHFHALEEEMVTHSSILAWRIPGMGESGGLPSMGLHRVRHNWSDLAAAAAVGKKKFIHSTPSQTFVDHLAQGNLSLFVFLMGEIEICVCACIYTCI